MAQLPDKASLDWLRKQAKQRLDRLVERDPDARLADAQFELAKEYGFPSWRALKAHVDALTVDGQLVDAARRGDVAALGRQLNEHPDRLMLRQPPYEWTLLHTAAHQGQLAAVNLLLARGIDPNVREKGDNTYPMHWAAAAGHVDVVRRLVEAGGDVTGSGDDHELEVIGWATCWNSTQDAAHRAVVDLLIEHGARHHIFSAIALGDAAEVRRIVARNSQALHQRMSRNENHQMPLHFAIRTNKPEMVDLLIELGADPLAVDGSGYSAAIYAMSPDVDRAVMERIRALTAAELSSAERGHRAVNANVMDLMAALAFRDWTTAERLVRDHPPLLGGRGLLHLAAKRGDALAVEWLLAHGAAPNELWAHWDANVTPLHLAAAFGHAAVVRLLLAARADRTIHDSKHDSDPAGWADFFGQPEIVALLQAAS